MRNNTTHLWNCSRRLAGFLLAAAFLALAEATAAERTPLIATDKARTDAIVEQVPLSGTIASARLAQLSSQVSGQVATVSIEVGDRVSQGDALIELDREIEQLTLEALQAATQRAKTEMADAQRRHADAKRLRETSSIAENTLLLLAAEVETDRADYRQRQADEKRQQALVERHVLRAPFDGVISERFAEAGEWIEPGNAVLTLVAVDDLRIEFRVPQEFYPRINDHATVRVSLDALPDRVFDGRITAVVPVSDSGSRTFMVHVGVDADSASMMPGMSVHGRLNLSTENRGVVVSRDAILRYPDGRVTVWTVNPGSNPPTVSERRVTTGTGFDGLVWIRSGLQEGETVVVRGNESLQEGQQVTVQDKR